MNCIKSHFHTMCFFARFFLFCAMCLGALDNQAWAQTRGGVGEQKPQQALMFMTFGARDEQGFFIEDQTGKEYSVVVADGATSGPFLRDQSDALEVFRMVPPSAEALASYEARRKAGETVLPPKPRREKLAEVKLPAGSANVLIMLVCSADRIRSSIPFDQSLAALPPATFRLHNMSKLPVALKLGEQQVAMEPGANDKVSISTPDGRPDMFRLEFAVQRAGEWQISDSGATAIDPQERRIVLITPGGKLGARLMMMPPAPPDPPPPVRRG